MEIIKINAMRLMEQSLLENKVDNSSEALDKLKNLSDKIKLEYKIYKFLEGFIVSSNDVENETDSEHLIRIGGNNMIYKIMNNIDANQWMKN